MSAPKEGAGAAAFCAKCARHVYHHVKKVQRHRYDDYYNEVRGMKPGEVHEGLKCARHPGFFTRSEGA